jgi:hypothetical protein
VHDGFARALVPYPVRPSNCWLPLQELETAEYPEPLCPTSSSERLDRRLGWRYPSVLAHTGSCARPSPSVPLGSVPRRPVFAGCCRPLLGDGPSRHYPCTPCVGAWTHTPPPPTGALAHFFPVGIGLCARKTRLADGLPPVMQFQQGPDYRGCSHSLRFRLLRSLGPPIAPTADENHPGGRAVYTTQPLERLPARGVASLRDRFWATVTAGLTPAGLQYCRLLLPESGSGPGFPA